MVFALAIGAGLVSAVVQASAVVGLAVPQSAARGSVVSGSVTLDAPTTDPAGLLVHLSSRDTSVARVPATVRVLSGDRTASFEIRTGTGGVTVAEIVASYQLSEVTAVLRLEPLTPVRGRSGDRWADVILGKPDFGEITPNLVTASRLFNPGGVLVDRTSRPNRLYVYDGGNSRVLGYSHLGQCASNGAACTTVLDCAGAPCQILPGRCRSEPDRRCFAGPDCADGRCVIDEGTLSADIVLGQPDATRSACNGDGNFQGFPVRAPASAATLCSMPEYQISPLEGGSFANMAVDASGNLYVPDFDNHRVLRYDSPFTTDRIADAVWGQADFSGNDCNRGRGPGDPDEESLCLRSPANEGFTGGVAIDPQGNLWVTDNQNNRVLRFPNGAGGVPGPQADLVLGQPDFHGQAPGSDLSQMWAPQAVRVGPDGTVFVADSQPGGGKDLGGRVLVFRPPLTSGMAATSVVGAGQLRNPTGLEIDPVTGGLWINDSSNNQLLLSGANPAKVLFKDVASDDGSCGGDFTGDGPAQYDPGNDAFIDTSAICGAQGGIGVDERGNVFVAASGTVQDLWRFPAPFPDPVRGLARSADKRIAVPLQASISNHVGAAGISSARGVAVYEPPAGASQLLVADRGRLLYWNDLASLSSGRPADGWVGAEDPSGRPSDRLQAAPDYGRIAADRARPTSHLWVLRGTGEILVYDLPLATGAPPTHRIAPGIPVAGGAGSIVWGEGILIGGVAAAPDGTRLWVADPDHHRVFRIRDPLDESRRVVDVVLGQGSANETDCNRGAGAPTRSSLCSPGAVALDPSGNVWVSDDALEYVGNFRMLEWDATGLEPAPGSALFGPGASRVLGAGGDFESAGCQDPMCAPWQPAFASNGAMVVGLNPYVSPSLFPLVVRDPLSEADSTEFLNDLGSQAYAAAFDSNDNLYLADLNRSRVLVYRDPLAIASSIPTAPRGTPVRPPPPGAPRRVPRD